MEHTLKKLLKVSISIISGISHFMLLWIFLSTVEIAIINTTHKKANDFNIFVLSNYVRTNTQNTPYSDTITGSFKNYLDNGSDESDEYYEEDDESDQIQYI